MKEPVKSELKTPNSDRHSQPEFNSSLGLISLRGARENNLKNVSLTIPHESFVVFTGVSGSGKSSLAFDTIFVEGQRRYIESLSPYARQFLPSYEKPEFDVLDGLAPTISIQQKTTSQNPRSTVGTVTEIYDYLRVLYARVSTAICPDCQIPISTFTSDQIVNTIWSYPEGTKLQILAPLVRSRKGEYTKELTELRTRGFTQARIDGEEVALDHEITLQKSKKHDILIYIDKLVLRKSDSLKQRLVQSIEISLKMTSGFVMAEPLSSKDSQNPEAAQLFSILAGCSQCGRSFPPPEPRIFSFNSSQGACSECEGLGAILSDATEETDQDGSDSVSSSSSGFALDSKDYFARRYAQHAISLCSSCQGRRLKDDVLIYQIQEKSIADVSMLSLGDALAFFQSLKFDHRKALIAERILKEIIDRLHFLNDVGVSYLTLDRPARSLSGGESQRIRLATQIGSSLTGIVYVLDEPSIGLHQRDQIKLIDSLKKLRNRGNTVIVVEHDRDTIEAADLVYDMGPGAGRLGGHLLAVATPKNLAQNPSSVTGSYLSGKKKISRPTVRRTPQKFLSLKGVSSHNIHQLDLEIPLGVLTFVTGVSGSGKSTLVMETLLPALVQNIYKIKSINAPCKSIEGWEPLERVIQVDQNPIGRTPRSNPATYSGIFSDIRTLFSQTTEAKTRGYKPGYFSFNVKGGRCETCQGGGKIKLEMNFLSDVYTKCPSCHGRRYSFSALDIRFKGKNIADILEMTFQEASEFFSSFPSIHKSVQKMVEVGLGYLTLGQSALTLSGGEAQRLKLATELSTRSRKKTFYLLDEPSTGLHFEDVQRLMDVLHSLVDQGHTVVVVEHQLEMIQGADHIIDMGPEGGSGGGHIVATGTPEKLAQSKQSLTGKYLQKFFST